MANLEFLEIIILAITAFITLSIGAFIGYQAHRHFLLQRSSQFAERFNSDYMITLRSSVDKLLHDESLAKEDWKKILSNDKDLTFEVTHKQITQVTTFANFFQELGVASVNKIVDRKYIWDIFGGLVGKYGNALNPFIEALRDVRERKTLYSDFDDLKKTMLLLDLKYKKD